MLIHFWIHLEHSKEYHEHFECKEILLYNLDLDFELESI